METQRRHEENLKNTEGEQKENHKKTLETMWKTQTIQIQAKRNSTRVYYLRDFWRWQIATHTNATQPKSKA